MKILLALLIFLILVGCQPIPKNDVYRDGMEDSHTSITRHVDQEAGVICYTYNGRGLSCLPLDNTRFGD